MEFQEWFKTQFGREVSRESLQDLQNEIEELEDRLDKLHEKRLELIEIQCLERGAYYAWNAERFRPKAPTGTPEAMATMRDLLENAKGNPYEKEFLQHHNQLLAD